MMVSYRDVYGSTRTTSAPALGDLTLVLTQPTGSEKEALLATLRSRGVAGLAEGGA